MANHTHAVKDRHSTSFDIHEVLHDLKHYLPSQTPLKDFIHHNSLHAFQELDFYSAIFKSSKIFGHQATFNVGEYRNLYKTGRIRIEILDKSIQDRKGIDGLLLWKERVLKQQYDSSFTPRIGQLRRFWKEAYHIDLDNLVQPLLFRILCSYLDQGIAIEHFPFENEGLLTAIRKLETNSFSSFFKTKRAKALLFDPTCTIESLLKMVVGDASFYTQYIFDQQFTHRGWSGMVSAIEDNPHSILYPKKISLEELLHFELLLELDNLDDQLGTNWTPLSSKVNVAPMDLFADVANTELEEVLKIWQDAFEWSYYDEVLAGVRYLSENPTTNSVQLPKSFQAIFCIDERECSLRRHVESSDTTSETYGCPGFFGVEFFFQPENGKFYEKLCPAPVTPQFLIKEYGVTEKHKHDLLYTKKTHTFLQGFLLSLSMGVWAVLRLFSNIFKPKMSPAISDAFSHMNMYGQLQVENKNPNDIENGLQLGFTVDQMVVRVEGLLRGIGLINDFAPLVYVVAHGSSSANNPHHGAHDCGACSGRPGATNARVFAFMANHPKVRAILSEKGLHIPDETQFVGAMHDTASDDIGYYDEDLLSVVNKLSHQQHKATFENALDLNAKERSRRFASIDTMKDIRKIRAAIRQRSVSMFEPRPELGHGTNALCFVGNRSLTKGLFLDRRAFMNSYDYRTDLDGKLLLNVMKPLPPVCGGINLEYYFSRIDNQKLGAGTKLPHNVMGLIGVSNSSDGDLRPGLPLQMIEVHDPVRLLILVEHYPEVVLNTIKVLPELYEWFANEWVHLLAIHPETNEFYFFKNGAFQVYNPIKKQVNVANDLQKLIESANEMKTNHIIDATKENLSIHVIQNNADRQ
jgi:uncharacterized protein